MPLNKIFLATNNHGKVERFKKLLASVGITAQVFIPADFGLEKIDPVEDGATLAENGSIKARAYFGKVDMPILANDTGFYVEGEGLIDAPKRKALDGIDEHALTKEEIAEKLLAFWKSVASKYGGRVDAAWVENFVYLYPDGNLRQAESRREVILTNQEFGEAHIQMPVRALYISKATGKPAITHDETEEELEMQPVALALQEVLNDFN